MAHLVARKSGMCVVPTWWCILYDGLGRGLAFSLNDQDVRGIWGNRGWGVCTSAVGFCWCSFQMHICTSFHGGRYRAQRASALRRKGSAASKAAGAEGQGIWTYDYEP